MRGWVDDHCEERLFENMSERRARGICAIHADCQPPCPRIRAARNYLYIDSPTIPIAVPAIAYMQSKVDDSWSAVGRDGRTYRLDADDMPEWLHTVFPAPAGDAGDRAKESTT
jgi:hypothetical protein